MKCSTRFGKVTLKLTESHARYRLAIRTLDRKVTARLPAPMSDSELGFSTRSFPVGVGVPLRSVHSCETHRTLSASSVSLRAVVVSFKKRLLQSSLVHFRFVEGCRKELFGCLLLNSLRLCTLFLEVTAPVPNGTVPMDASVCDAKNGGRLERRVSLCMWKTDLGQGQQRLWKQTRAKGHTCRATTPKPIKQTSQTTLGKLQVLRVALRSLFALGCSVVLVPRTVGLPGCVLVFPVTCPLPFLGAIPKTGR